MPYANNGGVKIYYEVEGQGPPLLLAHAWIQKVESWRSYGYVESLKNDYKLILFDARAHGKSDKPHEVSAFEANLMVGDVVAVLDDIGIEQAHYLGYSMGANVGLLAAILAPSRFQSFILGGIRRDVSQAVSTLKAYAPLLTDPESFLRQRERAAGVPMTDEVRTAILANDAEAVVASLKAHVDWPPVTDDELSRISVPCLLYCGDLDNGREKTKETAAHVPGARFVSLAGLDHGPAFMRSEMTLPHIKRFLTEITK